MKLNYINKTTSSDTFAKYYILKKNNFSGPTLTAFQVGAYL